MKTLADVGVDFIRFEEQLFDRFIPPYAAGAPFAKALCIAVVDLAAEKYGALPALDFAFRAFLRAARKAGMTLDQVGDYVGDRLLEEET